MSNFESKQYYEQEITRQELSAEELQTRLENFNRCRQKVFEIQVFENEEKTKEQDILRNLGFNSLEDLLEQCLIDPEEGISIIQNLDNLLNNPKEELDELKPLTDTIKELRGLLLEEGFPEEILDNLENNINNFNEIFPLFKKFITIGDYSGGIRYLEERSHYTDLIEDSQEKKALEDIKNTFKEIIKLLDKDYIEKIKIKESINIALEVFGLVSSDKSIFHLPSEEKDFYKPFIEDVTIFIQNKFNSDVDSNTFKKDVINYINNYDIWNFLNNNTRDGKITGDPKLDIHYRDARIRLDGHHTRLRGNFDKLVNLLNILNPDDSKENNYLKAIESLVDISSSNPLINTDLLFARRGYTRSIQEQMRNVFSNNLDEYLNIDDSMHNGVQKYRSNGISYWSGMEQRTITAEYNNLELRQQYINDLIDTRNNFDIEKRQDEIKNELLSQKEDYKKETKKYFEKLSPDTRIQIDGVIYDITEVINNEVLLERYTIVDIELKSIAIAMQELEYRLDYQVFNLLKLDIKEGKITGDQKYPIERYIDLFDPTNDFFNLSINTKNFLLEEIVSLPLTIFAITKISSMAIRYGSRVPGMQGLSTRVQNLQGLNGIITRGAINTGGVLVEGAVFDTLTAIRHNRFEDGNLLPEGYGGKDLLVGALIGGTLFHILRRYDINDVLPLNKLKNYENLLKQLGLFTGVDFGANLVVKGENVFEGEGFFDKMLVNLSMLILAHLGYRGIRGKKDEDIRKLRGDPSKAGNSLPRNLASNLAITGFLGGSILNVMGGYKDNEPDSLSDLTPEFNKLLTSNLSKEEILQKGEKEIYEIVKQRLQRIKHQNPHIDITSPEATQEILIHQLKLQQEFRTLLEKKLQQENIPNTISMTLTLNGQELPPWELKIQNTEFVNEYFGRLVEGMRNMEEEESEEIYPN